MNETRVVRAPDRRRSVCPVWASARGVPIANSSRAGIQTLSLLCPTCQHVWAHVRTAQYSVINLGVEESALSSGS